MQVDLEPNEPTDKLSNVTFRECTAAGNTDNAFDIRANFLTTPVSILFERCVARDCAGLWGSAFSLSSLVTKAAGSSISGKIVILSRFVALSVSLILKAWLLRSDEQRQRCRRQ